MANRYDDFSEDEEQSREQKRIDALRTLRQPQLDPEGLVWLSQWFHIHYPSDISTTYLYATPEGGVRVEWSTKNVESSLCIDLTTRRAWWHALDWDSDEDEEKTIDMDNLDDVAWLVAHLRQVARK